MMLVQTNKPPMPGYTFRVSQYAIGISYCVLLFFLSACSPIITPTPFIAPYGQRFTPTAVSSASVWTPTALDTPAPEINLRATSFATSPATASAVPQISTTPEPAALFTQEPTAFAELPSPTPITCSDSLRYLQDLTYPDESIVSAGQAIEKQWLVENNGTCNWDGNYRLKLLEGYPSLGAAGEVGLYPARAGAQATISIHFIAPLEAGTYHTAWQAYNSLGTAFGETIYMLVVVSQ